MTSLVLQFIRLYSHIMLTLLQNYNKMPGGRKTVMCKWYPNCYYDDADCKFKHGEDDKYIPGQTFSDTTSKYKIVMCQFELTLPAGCNKGSNCTYAHSEPERLHNVRLANIAVNAKYKSVLCEKFERGGSQICGYAEKCHFLHPGDPDYAAYVKRMDAQWVPVPGDITRPMAYASYADAVRSYIAEAEEKEAGPLPTYRTENLTTKVIDMAVANGCDKDHWTKLCDDITEGYTKLERLDTTISQWNEDPCRVQYSQKIADAKAERVCIENELRDIVFEKNAWLNKDILELHGFRHAQDAVKLVRLRLREIRRDPSILPEKSLRKRTLTLITGAGNRSAGDPKILGAVLDFLATHYDPEMLNAGCVVVPFQRLWF